MFQVLKRLAVTLWFYRTICWKWNVPLNVEFFYCCFFKPMEIMYGWFYCFHTIENVYVWISVTFGLSFQGRTSWFSSQRILNCKYYQSKMRYYYGWRVPCVHKLTFSKRITRCVRKTLFPIGLMNNRKRNLSNLFILAALYSGYACELYSLDLNLFIFFVLLCVLVLAKSQKNSRVIIQSFFICWNG